MRAGVWQAHVQGGGDCEQDAPGACTPYTIRLYHVCKCIYGMYTLHTQVYDKYTSKVVEIVSKMRQGPALGEKPVDCGAMCMPGLAEKVQVSAFELASAFFRGERGFRLVLMRLRGDCGGMCSARADGGESPGAPLFIRPVAIPYLKLACPLSHLCHRSHSQFRRWSMTTATHTLTVPISHTVSTLQVPVEDAAAKGAPQSTVGTPSTHMFN